MDPASTPEADQVVEAVRQGAIDRFEELILAHQQQVWAIVACSRLDRDTARELVHQTFVAAYSSLDQYQVGTSFRFWIKAIARNQVRHELRRREVRHRHEDAYRRELERRLDEDEADGSAAEVRREALRLCRSGLNPVHGRLIELHYEQGQGLEAIAGLLGRSAAATKQMLWRVRQLLRRCIEQRLGGLA